MSVVRKTQIGKKIVKRKLVTQTHLNYYVIQMKQHNSQNIANTEQLVRCYTIDS